MHGNGIRGRFAAKLVGEVAQTACFWFKSGEIIGRAGWRLRGDTVAIHEFAVGYPTHTPIVQHRARTSLESQWDPVSVSFGGGSESDATIMPMT